MQEVFKISNLDQIRLLSDPFKLGILQAFAEGERTTSEVAEVLGQPVTKLYRHVDALHDAGLLKITREKKKRGTIERHFQAVGQRFEADHSLFSSESDEDAVAIRDVLRAGEDEIVDAIRRSDDSEDGKVTLVRMRLKGSPARLAELQQQLTHWVESVQQDDEPQDGESMIEAGVLVAFYPIDEDKR
ncbi:MAG: helix-turn-helix domain-containing protein [Woeseiaceae bacterium]|nr:helix-turn-helix domain-containing protein [Woeseiaceae bacterium]